MADDTDTCPLYLTAKGIQTKVSENRWRPWRTEEAEFNIPQDRWQRDGGGCDGSPPRAFVCRTCQSERAGQSAWLMKCDVGVLPKHLKPLGLLEQIVFNKYVMYGYTNKMGCMKTSTGATVSRVEKLYGHMVACPLSNVQLLESECTELPRREFAKYAAQIIFIGSGKQYKMSRKLTFRHGIYQLRIDVLKAWMEFEGMDEELMRLTNDEDGYRAAWDSEFEKLEKMSCKANDGAI